MENNLEGVLTIKKEGVLKAIICNDQKKRAPITYICKEASLEDIQELFRNVSEIPKLIPAQIKNDTQRKEN